MKNALLLFILLVSIKSFSQQTPDWLIEANSIDPNNYYGVTVANGMIGLVSSDEPMKVKDVGAQWRL